MVVAAHRRLTFSGLFGGVAAPWEYWSFRLNHGVDGTIADRQAALTSALAAYTTHIAPLTRSFVILTEIKLAEIAAGGLYSADPTIKAVEVGGTASATGAAPLQISLAVSLRTATRGASGRGRFYIPGPAAQMSAADGLVPTGSSQGAATAAGSFLTALNAIDGLGNVVIASQTGSNNVVTAVRVGRVLDTIRSRRRSLDESYGADVAVASGT